MRRLTPKSEFSRNVLTLMTGTTIAQAIPIAASPILTRMYSPDDFGVLSLFMSLSLIFGSVANGRYELAIMLPDSDEDAFNIAALGGLIAFCLSLFLFVLIVFFNRTIATFLGHPELSSWLFFLPVAVFFIGMFNVLNYFNNRIKRYRDIAIANMYKSLGLVTVQLSFGYLFSGATGLISGQLFSTASANFKLFKNTLKSVDYRSALSLVRIKQLAFRYIDFPKYSMWAIWANTLSENLTNILISSFFSVMTLGYYALVQRVLGMPTALVGGAIGQVFFQEATKEKLETGAAIHTFNTTVKKLLYISLPMFSLLYLFVEDIFSLVFGEDWRIAGTYAKMVIPLFMVRFIVSSVTTINSIFEKQKISFLWQLALLAITLLSVFVSVYFNIEFYNFLKILTITVTCHYLVLFYILKNISAKKL